MKRWIYTVGFAGLIAILLIPFMGFSANAKGKPKISPNQVTLESGAVGVPFAMVGDLYPGFYHEPEDGIIAGMAGALGCVPDVHEFDKSVTAETSEGIEYQHIVFTADITEITTNEEAEYFNNNAKIYVEISSNGKKVLESEFFYHGPDPNFGKPFWVSAVYLNGPRDERLPTGEYEYKFKAKANAKNGHVLAVWKPKNNKFTITDSSVNN